MHDYERLVASVGQGPRLFLASGTPLYGHTNEHTAYLVDDYPYGFNKRCRIRYWLEKGSPAKGFRFVSQTEDPVKLRWNKPKASTYMPLAACMFLDAQHHVDWKGLSHYSKGHEALEFVKHFTQADFSYLKPFAAAKVRMLQGMIEDKVHMTINGVKQEWTEDDKGRHREDHSGWTQVLQAIG